MQTVVKTPLEAPIGKTEMVQTPWGSLEQAHVFNMQDYIDGMVKYAIIFNPVGNYKVRCSTFRIR